MKNLRVLFAALLFICSTALQAQTFSAGEMTFNIFSESDKTVELYKFSSSEEVLNIPSQVTYEGETYSVVSISRDFSNYNDRTTTIIIPASITNINTYAFFSYPNVKTVLIFATTAPTLGEYFFGENGRKDVLLLYPKNSDYSQWKNHKSDFAEFREIDITHDFCVDGLFYSITDEENRTVSLTAPHNDEKADYMSLVGMYSGKIAIPETVVHNNVEYTVTGINNNTFRRCEGVTSISLPSTINSIQQEFSAGSKLMSITVDADNPVYDSRDNCNAVIETATNTLITACNSTFIPETVTTIGTQAFRNCRSLESIHIPASVIEIRNYNPFFECPSLNSITVDENNPVYDSRDNCNAIIETESNTLISGCNTTVITSTIEYINQYSFNECPGITEITIPLSVKSINTMSFIWLENLERINIEKGHPVFYDDEGLNAIINRRYDNIILGCKNTAIPAYINNYYIDAYAFSRNKITDIKIFTNERIGSYAFWDCKELRSVTIGKDVTYIHNSSFQHCSNLTTVTSLIPADKLFTIPENAFEGISKNCTLYVPAGAKDTYAATEGWKNFNNIIEIEIASFDLTVSAAGYATLYLDYNATIPQGVEVYTASTVDGNRLMMEQINHILPANTGVIVRAEEGTYTFEEYLGEAEAIEGNLFCGSVEDEYITPEKNAKYYVLSMKDGVVGMYEDALSGGTFKNNAHKAYLVLSPKIGIYDEEVDTENPGMQLSNSYYFYFGGTTAIDPVVTEVNDNIYYDLSGRRVENPAQGIYIVNGKKVLVK